MPEDKKWQFELEEYIRQGEPEQAEKSEAWQIAIGLQQVDGLNTSAYLLDTAKEHIEGKISIAEAQKRIRSYYEERTDRKENEDETKEADIVSARIAQLLGEKTFQFSPAEWMTIHRRLFEGVFDHTGKIRTYNITKKEWVLKVDNNAFKRHSWYFRNALVRANYNDLKNGIHATTKYLEMFFSNLLMGMDYELKNRYMHVDYVQEQDDKELQSINLKVPKVQNDTLKCTLEEMAIVRLISENPVITQNELVKATRKSISTVKRIMNSLQEKGYIRRVNGKRYGKWEVLVDLNLLLNEKG